jgi:hypothetical protein
MKPLSFLAILLVLTASTDAQSLRSELTPAERTARIEATRDARRQRIRAERVAARQKAREAGRLEAKALRVRDRALMAVWSRLTPDVRAMYAARQLVERVSRQPEWTTQTRAERIAAVTAFVTNYQAIKAARQQATMEAALGAAGSAYPAAPALDAVARVLNAKPAEIQALKKAGDPVELAATVQPPSIPAFPEATVPDLFTISRRFNWGKPHGQWMNQMLKDIDAAKAKGDADTYRNLTGRYSAWADKYLRLDASPDLDGNPGR